MGRKLLCLALIGLVTLPAEAADPQWRMIDSVVACYESLGAIRRCRSFGIVERTPDERMLCTVWAGAAKLEGGAWRAHISCQTTSWERMHDRGGDTPGIDKLQLDSDPPQQIRRGKTQWGIDGDTIIGSVETLACAPPRELR
jgi:hypothetical protein